MLTKAPITPKVSWLIGSERTPQVFAHDKSQYANTKATNPI
jgi:hypothetical protein